MEGFHIYFMRASKQFYRARKYSPNTIQYRKKRKLQIFPFRNKDAEILNKILANWIWQYVKGITDHCKLKLVQKGKDGWMDEYQEID